MGSVARDLRLLGRPDEDARRLAIVEVLATISEGIGTDATPDSLYLLILRQATRVIAFDEAAITLLEGGSPITVATVGEAFGQALVGIKSTSFWYAAGSLSLSVGAREPGLADIVDRFGIEDLISTPLRVNGTVVGRLTFGSRESGRYDTHGAQLAALLAERAAQVVRTARLQAAHELAVVKLVQLDTLREQFVATVSHELRTPLTGILGYLDLLISRWETLPDDRRRGMLERTQSSAARLEHLVADLLLFSNVEHQELQLQITNVPLAALVHEAIDDIATKFRGQVVEVRPSAREIQVCADARRLVQVLGNLLDNAVKYSQPGAPVHVRWVAHRRTVEVAVRDHGPGIAAADLPRLFTRFGTLGHQPRPGQAGTGIGLYLCRKLLDAMGGRIWATSRPGQGSTFHFTLPREPLPALGRQHG